MVADSFIPGKPALSALVGGLLTTLTTLLAGWLLLSLEIGATKTMSDEKELKNKIENAATTVYVDGMHEIAIKHTDDEIKKHSDNEDKLRSQMQTQVTAIYTWVLSQQGIKD